MEEQPQIGVPCSLVYEIGISQRDRALYTHLQLSDVLPDSFEAHSEVYDPDSAEYVRIVRRVVAKRRGEAVLSSVDLRWTSRFGLWQKYCRYDIRDEYLVHPDMTTWKSAVLALQRSFLQEGSHVKRMLSGYSEFAHISEYTVEDDPRTINWAATARRQRVMKNVYQPERGQQVVIAVDASRYMGIQLPDGKTKLDYSVETALALAQTAMLAGDSVGVVVFTNRVVYQLPASRGTVHFRRMVSALAQVRAERVQGGYEALLGGLSGRFHRRGLFVVLSEVEGAMTDSDFLPTFRQFQRRHPTLFITLRDIDVESVFKHLPRKGKELSRWAAAEVILTERRRAVELLEASGVSVLESLPGDMVVDAVAEYARRKRRFSL